MNAKQAENNLKDKLKGDKFLKNANKRFILPTPLKFRKHAKL